MSADRAELRFLKQPEVRGVSKDLILDLEGIVENWGKANPATGLVEFRSGLLQAGVTLNVTLSTLGPERVLMVMDGEAQLEIATIFETNKGKIIWDKTLPAARAKEAVREVDAQYQEQGFYDPQTKSRKPIPAELAIQRPADRLKVVSVVFANPENVFMTKLDRPLENILAEFDEPDKLIIEVLGDYAMISRKDDSQSAGQQ